MKYLYDKVQEKIEELMKKSPKMEMDLETLKRKLPDRVRLTRWDVVNVVKELEKDGKFIIDGGKLKGGEKKHG